MSIRLFGLDKSVYTCINDGTGETFDLFRQLAQSHPDPYAKEREKHIVIRNNPLKYHPDAYFRANGAALQEECDVVLCFCIVFCYAVAGTWALARVLVGNPNWKKGIWSCRNEIEDPRCKLVPFFFHLFCSPCPLFPITLVLIFNTLI